MNPRRTRIKKANKEPARKGNLGHRLKITVPWGRGASEYRPGKFCKAYLLEHGDGCCADVFYALNEDLERINKKRIEIGEAPIRGSTYNSFAKYWHWFKLLGLIEPVNRREESIYPFLEARTFYRLTEKGTVEVNAWQDPVRVAHPEFL